MEENKDDDNEKEVNDTDDVNLSIILRKTFSSKMISASSKCLVFITVSKSSDNCYFHNTISWDVNRGQLRQVKYC